MHKNAFMIHWHALISSTNFLCKEMNYSREYYSELRVKVIKIVGM